MTITCRKLDANGDIVIGQGKNSFLTGLDAVTQTIDTRLLLRKGDFWRDLNAGLPLFQNILGSSGSVASQGAIANQIQTIVLGTPDVTEIVNLSTDFDSKTRTYTYQANVQTTDSTASISGTL